MIINTGEYIVNIYNKYGSQLKDNRFTASSLIDARVIAQEQLIGDEEAVSYTIDRRIDNSIDG